MSEYSPYKWVVVKFKGDDPHYRVLGSWSGGYLDSDSWRMNSGITSVNEDEQDYRFFGSSGSCYVCNKESYGMILYTSAVYDNLKEIHGDNVELMPQDTDWSNIL
tara:strand:+ start:932 stop:1246 length:315 start_codon:yes stop_codon:yes gene_type:complete